jgi:hypothetical protein
MVRLSWLAFAGCFGQLLLGLAFIALLGLNRNETDAICLAIVGAGLAGLAVWLWRPLRLPVAVLDWVAVPLIGAVLLIGAKEWGGAGGRTLTLIRYGRPEYAAPAAVLLGVAATLAATLTAAVGLTWSRGREPGAEQVAPDERRTRRWQLVGSVLGLFIVAALAGLWWAAKPIPCHATFDRVRTGMTRSEIIAAVGPPGWYARNHAEKDYGIVMPSQAGEIPPVVKGSEVWVAEDAQMVVYFDGQDRAWRVWVFAGLYRLSKDASEQRDE